MRQDLKFSFSPKVPGATQVTASRTIVPYQWLLVKICINCLRITYIHITHSDQIYPHTSDFSQTHCLHRDSGSYFEKHVCTLVIAGSCFWG